MNEQHMLTSWVTHVGEHITAITCVSTAELGGKVLLPHVGQDLAHWPSVILIALAIGIYFAGLLTARLVRRQWLRWRRLSRPLLGAGDADARRREAAVLALAGTALVIGLVALFRRPSARPEGDAR